MLQSEQKYRDSYDLSMHTQLRKTKQMQIELSQLVRLASKPEQPGQDFLAQSFQKLCMHKYIIAVPIILRTLLHGLLGSNTQTRSVTKSNRIKTFHNRFFLLLYQHGSLSLHLASKLRGKQISSTRKREDD